MIRNTKTNTACRSGLHSQGTRIFLALILILLTATALAAPQSKQKLNIEIREAFADLDTLELVLIGGEFVAPLVSLGDDPTVLSVLSNTGTVLVVELPPGLLDGDYRVKVEDQSDSKANAEISMTIGAVGPEGPVGATGPAGPPGALAPAEPGAEAWAPDGPCDP